MQRNTRLLHNIFVTDCLSFFSARTRDHRSFLIAQKITSSKFPEGGYLLIHYPFAKHLFSTRRNDIIESNSHHTFDLITSNEIDNVEEDISNEIRVRQSRENGNLKNKYSMKFKRNAQSIENMENMIIEHCCASDNDCGKYFCSHWNNIRVNQIYLFVKS